MTLKDDYGVHLGLHLQYLESLGGGVPSGLPEQLAEVAPFLESFDSARDRINGDTDLSPIGRDNQLKAARAEAEADIERWRTSKTTGIESQMSAVRASMEAVADTLTKPTDLQIQTMVQRLSGFDPLEVDILYADATDAERLVIESASDAIGRTPVRRGDVVTWEPLVPAERVEAVRTQRLVKANPAGMASLHDLSRIRNAYDSLAGSAKALLKES